MRKQALIDLYVHSSTGSIGEIADVASNLGLDAVCYVVDSIEEMPAQEEMNLVNERGHANLFPGFCIEGNGTRWLVLVPDWDDAPMEVLETTDDAQLLADAVGELGGAIVPICPHQMPDGEAIGHVGVFPKDHPVGWVSMVVDGSHLGRHLDMEGVSLIGRRNLGATGPFGRVDHMGRFATLIPADASSLASITSALNEGLGVCVELRQAPEPKKSKKRGRRRRRPRRKGSKGSAEKKS